MSVVPTIGGDGQVGVAIIPDPPEERHCPGCGRTEDIKCVCRACGYEYPSEDDPWWKIALIVLAVIAALVVVLWFGVMMMEWLTSFRDVSLREVVVQNLEWLRSRRVW